MAFCRHFFRVRMSNMTRSLHSSKKRNVADQNTLNDLNHPYAKSIYSYFVRQKVVELYLFAETRSIVWKAPRKHELMLYRLKVNFLGVEKSNEP